MALGAMTHAVAAGAAASAPLFADRISFAGDAAYAAGGSAFDAAFRALTKSGRKPLCVIAGDCGGYIPAYDPATGKLKVYRGDNDGGADGPLVEVPATTDLSAVTFNLTVLSQ